eukprot:scaffold40421_cov61-Phaeocystis_antarctica.AAC.2
MDFQDVRLALGLPPRGASTRPRPLLVAAAAGGAAVARAPRSRLLSSCAADPTGRSAGTCRTACFRSLRS